MRGKMMRTQVTGSDSIFQRCYNSQVQQNRHPKIWGLTQIKAPSLKQIRMAIFLREREIVERKVRIIFLPCLVLGDS